MFTGIIESVGEVKKIEGNIFTISHGFGEKFAVGDSIALSGMCTTVLDATEDVFSVEVMEESRRRTIFGDIKEGGKINLERSAVMGGRNSGHFVLGHVDQVGRILERKTVGDYELFRVSISDEFSELIVFKGSITVDGVSLTISDLGRDWFEVSIISHTLEVTTLGEKQVGDGVDLEFDILGKYILRREEVRGE